MAGSRADWSRLTAWLRERTEPYVTIDWAALDSLVGGIPASATNHYPQWWRGERSHTRSWRNAGYELDQLDLGQAITFRRVTDETWPVKAHDAEFRTASGEATTRLADIDPLHAMIVLQCSARKAVGGSREPVGSARWPSALLDARARLVAAAQTDERELMPAWRRYTGGFYAAAGDAMGEAVEAGTHIVIISGGYGVLRVDEPIGLYERVFRASDWPRGLLSSLLVEEATRTRAQAVVAFTGTSTSYAQLVRATPWSAAGVSQAVLITVMAAGGGAMGIVPRALGQAFRAFWRRGHVPYPDGLVLENLS